MQSKIGVRIIHGRVLYTGKYGMSILKNKILFVCFQQKGTG